MIFSDRNISFIIKVTTPLAIIYRVTHIKILIHTPKLSIFNPNFINFKNAGCLKVEKSQVLQHLL